MQSIISREANFITTALVVVIMSVEFPLPESDPPVVVGGTPFIRLRVAVADPAAVFLFHMKTEMPAFLPLPRAPTPRVPVRLAPVVVLKPVWVVMFVSLAATTAHPVGRVNL